MLQSGKEWTVTAILNDASGNPVLSDSWTIPASNKKANLFHRFWVKPVVTSGGTGTLALTLLLNNDLDGVVSKVTADCKSSTSNTENWEVSILPTEENMTFQEGSPLQVSISQASIASGQYEVSFNFYDASNVLVYNTVQTINIFDNLTTNTWVSGGGSAPIKADGTFELTKDLVDGYSRTHLYVGATAFCTSPSNDNATGTAAKPFASVTGAIDYLRMVGSAEQDYTIYLVGSLDGGQTIEDSSDTIPAKSITLIGFNGLDSSTNQPKDSIEASDTQTALTISTEIPVTVKDLKISKGTGHGVDVSSSSKLYLAGTPVIDDLYLESTSTYDEEYYSPGSLLLAEDLGSFASITITPDTYTAPYYDDSEGGYIIKVQYVSIEEESTIDIAENSKYFSITPELDGDENPTDTEWIIDNDGCLNKYCILTFEGEGINSMTTQKVPCTYFEPGKLIEPTREGYLFKGYYYQKETEHWGGSQYSPEQQPSTYEMLSFDYKEADYEDEEGNTVTDSDYTFVNSDMTLYATWRCLTINNIYVDADNGADAAWCSQDGSTISLGDGSEGFLLRTLNSAFDLIKEINDATEDYTITISGLTSEYNLVVDDNLPVNSLTFKGISSAGTDGIYCTGQALDNFNSVLQIATAAPVVIQNMKVKLALWSYEVDGAVMNVGSGSTVTLKAGTIFEGSGNSITSKGAVSIEDDGTLIMEDDVTFKNFAIKGGAVNVKTGGTFIMNGGTFEDNSSDGTCGAVYVNGGTFTMNDGYIKNNWQDAFQRDYLLPQGAGVCVASGTFIMEGGHITNNESYVSNVNSNYTTAGGGVFVYANGTFIMHGGEITGNHAYNKAKYSNGTTSDDSTAQSYGGGVCLQASGDKIASFTMTGGTISGNTAGTSGNGIGFIGTPSDETTGVITIGGTAVISSSNDIYLPDFMTIAVASELTGSDSLPTITPANYERTTPVLTLAQDAAETLVSEFSKFKVTANGSTTYTISELGKLVASTNGGNGGSSIPDDFVQVTGASITSAPIIVLDDDDHTQNTEGAFSAATTTNPITVSSFYMCEHEVTQAEYELYCIYGDTAPSETSNKDQYPVYNISWYDAIVYCNLRSMAELLTPVYSVKKAEGEGKSTDPATWVGIQKQGDGDETKYCGPDEQTSAWDWVAASPGYDNIEINETANGYRLPTAMEWEYAGRGGNGLTGNQTMYSGSNNIEVVSFGDYSIHKIMQKSPNALQIYDMSGSVCEWLWDVYGEDWRGMSTLNDLINYSFGVEPYNRSSGSYKLGLRVVRNAQ